MDVTLHLYYFYLYIVKDFGSLSAKSALGIKITYFL